MHHLPPAVVRVHLLRLVRRQLRLKRWSRIDSVVPREVLENGAHHDEGDHALDVRSGGETHGEEDDDQKRVDDAEPVDTAGFRAEVAVAVVVEAVRPGGGGGQPLHRVGEDYVHLLAVRK